MLSRPGALPAACATTVETAGRIAAEVRTAGEIETTGWRLWSPPPWKAIRNHT